MPAEPQSGGVDLQTAIESAVARTYEFSLWKFSNEAEFKHELFHQLAQFSVDGVSLANRVATTPTCRLHAEGRIENGIPSRADLLICNPFEKQRFNYHVDYLIELKSAFTKRALRIELEKFSKYTRTCRGVYFVAADTVPLDLTSFAIPSNAFVIGRSGANIRSSAPALAAEMEFYDAMTIVRAVVSETLRIYGESRKQYQSFFWCNYEAEEWRKHSFPCEGDFVAQLYHRLRQKLPPSVEIRSEVHPPATSLRVDLVIESRLSGWRIPLEVKMNWDQFKPKFKSGVRQLAESHLILSRFAALCSEVSISRPILVVTQWEWRLPGDIRRVAWPLVQKTANPLEVFGYDENSECVVHETFRCRA